MIIEEKYIKVETPKVIGFVCPNCGEFNQIEKDSSFNCPKCQIALVRKK